MKFRDQIFKTFYFWEICGFIIYTSLLIVSCLFQIDNHFTFTLKNFSVFNDAAGGIGFAVLGNSIGNIFILFGTLFAIAASITRIMKHKATIYLSIPAASLIGVGLVVNGVGSDGILNACIYVIINCFSLKQYNNNTTFKTTNSWPKFNCKFICILTTIYALLAILWLFIGNGGIGYSYEKIIKNDYSVILKYLFDVTIAFLAVLSAITMFYFKSSKAFILWNIVNILSMFLYSPLIWTGWNMNLFLLMFLYLLINFRIFMRWKNENN